MQLPMAYSVLNTTDLCGIYTIDALEDPAQEITEYLDMAYPRSESAKGKYQFQLKGIVKNFFTLLPCIYLLLLIL